MTKARLQYVCQSCGYTSSKWLGRCPSCGEWNSLVEEVQSEFRAAVPVQPSVPVAVTQVATVAEPRLATGIAEYDRVLGGGLVPGSLVLIGGDPGIGKCVTGDTRVLDPESGAYLTISAWETENRPVLAVDEQRLLLGTAQVAAFHRRGTRP